MSTLRREALKVAAGQGLHFRPDALKAAVAFAEEHLKHNRPASETLLALMSEARADSAQLDAAAVTAAM
eukprot:SAG31_NODE_23402_length_505_cov_0.913793_1_plen_68_part_01